MKFSTYMQEDAQMFYGFSSLNKHAQRDILTHDLVNLNIEHSIADDDTLIDSCKCAYIVNCIDRNETTVGVVKRLLLSAGWQDLAQTDCVSLFKRSIYIKIYNSASGVTVALCKTK